MKKVMTGIFAMFVFAAAAHAVPGDEASITKARTDYENAKKSNNEGVIAAMKSALDFQLNEAKKIARKENQGR